MKQSSFNIKKNSQTQHPPAKPVQSAQSNRAAGQSLIAGSQPNNAEGQTTTGGTLVGVNSSGGALAGGSGTF